MLVYGITGPPGVGKSCLVDRLASAWSESGHSLSILCVDPSSSISGGALLADRMRMSIGANETVHIRSIATRGASGGLSGRIQGMVDVLQACGRDRIIIETAGVGQTELGIATLADRIILVEGPDRGDMIQAEKAGISELCDLIVVNKSDLPNAERAAHDLRAAIELGPNPADVLLVSAKNGNGFDELLLKLEDLPLRTEAAEARARLRFLAAIQSSVIQNAQFEQLVIKLTSNEISIHEALDSIGLSSKNEPSSGQEESEQPESDQPNSEQPKFEQVESEEVEPVQVKYGHVKSEQVGFEIAESDGSERKSE
jgi:LAO/AO transport system kinase